MIKSKRWVHISEDKDLINQLSGFLGISPVIANLLINRGLTDNDSAFSFLYPDAKAGLHSPFLMKDMDKAIRRIRKAIKNKEKIVIYGDYDVDGTTSTIILKKVISILGGDVHYYIPERLIHGYGLRKDALDKLKKEGYSLVITVDTGVKAFEEIAYAKKHKIDVIVTDHHLVDKDKLPKAVAILNPKRNDCQYPEKNLAGVGVSFKLAQGLLIKAKKESIILSLLKIAAIGTIADIVPLVGENRVITKYGLAGLSSPTNPGLLALLKISGLSGKSVNYRDIGFKVGPRINAMGRMGAANSIIDLFDAKDDKEAKAIAKIINSQNTNRRGVQDTIVEQMVKTVESRPELIEGKVIVLSGEGWHRGVIGIAANKLVDKYNKPAVVISVENGVGVGSARSINGFHLIDGLTGVGDIFKRFGGHSGAAGFSIDSTRIDEFRDKINKFADELKDTGDGIEVIQVEGVLNSADIDEGLMEELALLEPHGPGNEPPVFCTFGMQIVATPLVLKEKHLKLRLSDGNTIFDALWWSEASAEADLYPGDRVNIAYTLEKNEWKGKSSVQMVLKDLKLCSAMV